MARALRAGRRAARRVPRAGPEPPLTPLEVLLDSTAPGDDLPEELARLYGGGLSLAETCLFANFVQTIDGVVAIPDLERSNAIVAGGSEADRFVMGVLRALADVVLLGSGTVLGSPTGTWQPGRVYPPAAESLAELRRRHGRPERVPVAIVTAGGSFDPTHPLLEAGALVLTTDGAAPGIRASAPAAAEVVAVNDGERVDLRLAVDLLRERGHASILSEAGPHVLGSLLADGLVDELFLTVSPLLAGRGTDPRLALVEGVELLPDASVAGRVLSVRRHEEHLFLRYGLR